jgi:hypothetical protein
MLFLSTAKEADAESEAGKKEKPKKKGGVGCQKRNWELLTRNGGLSIIKWGYIHY